ncbi:MAG: hypothetical protein IPL47_16140 [Phyllobacteriaceae bacterium]|nr:hypothetical protein [Phyllobacteriaceae bacterium]
MARILAFPKQAREKPGEPVKGGGAIVMFTGVRYERLDDTRTPTTPRKKSRRKA